MAPITRSSRMNVVNTKNVLVDSTNIPKMSKTNENKEKRCVYSQNDGQEGVDVLSNGGLTVYDFVGTSSPSRKVVKKAKSRQKKKPLSKSDDEIVFPVKNMKNIKYNTRQKQTTRTNGINTKKIIIGVSAPSENEGNVAYREGEKENRNPKKSKKNVVKGKKSSVRKINENMLRESMINISYQLSENEQDKMLFRRERENTNLEKNKQNIVKENKSAKSEIGEYVMRDNMNSTSAKPLEMVGTNALNGSCVSISDVWQNVACIPADSENKDNYSETNFRRPRCSFGFSPIAQERDFFVTKRTKKKKYCVEDFTVENYFGFDEESDEEMKSPEYRLSAYAMASTPNDKNEPTRSNRYTSRILLPRYIHSFDKTTETKKTLDKDRSCVDSTASYFEPVKRNKPPHNQLNGCADVVSTKLHVTSTNITQSTCTEISHVASTQVPQVTSTVIPQHTSTTSSNHSPILFGENPVESSFSKPPRQSYERKRRVRWDSQTEAQSLIEDEVPKPERNKSSKKRKVKEDKIFAKWAANLSAEFEEVESFELCME